MKLQHSWLWMLPCTTLATMLAACAPTQPTKTHPAKGLPVTIRVSPTPRLLSRPVWLNSRGVTTVNLGFATGYMLNAYQNVVIWRGGGWEFQVVGPLTVANPVEAQTLYQTFNSRPMSGQGVIRLTERHKLWSATISRKTREGFPEQMSFSISGTNTGLVYAVYNFVKSRSFAKMEVLHCSAHLSMSPNGIRDSLTCP